MEPIREPRWDASVAEAEAIQREWARLVVDEDALGPVRAVAGVDVAYEKDGERLFAAVVVLDARTLEVIDEAVHEERARFPYVPGLFSFRELPPIVQCFAKIAREPDLIVCDGQGRAHPRRFGLACHLGVLFDRPAIGCAKTMLVGSHAALALPRGSHAPILDAGETVGLALRTRTAVKPIYVSVGHRVSLDAARLWVMHLTPRYRLPETTRAADQRVNAMRRTTLSGS